MKTGKKGASQHFFMQHIPNTLQHIPIVSPNQLLQQHSHCHLAKTKDCKSKWQ